MTNQCEHKQPWRACAACDTTWHSFLKRSHLSSAGQSRSTFMEAVHLAAAVREDAELARAKRRMRK